MSRPARWQAARRPHTCKGKPLYTYKFDGGPGAISGDDVDGVWHVVKP
jgi:predicted lipoprotein with Yx(FWY)xxD motif